MENYKGSIDLISGLRPKNGGAFALMEARNVQTREDDTRLDAELALIWEALAALRELIESGGSGSGGTETETLTVGDLDDTTVSMLENKFVSEVEA